MIPNRIGSLSGSVVLKNVIGEYWKSDVWSVTVVASCDVIPVNEEAYSLEPQGQTFVSIQDVMNK